MRGLHRLMPVTALIDRYSQARYRTVTDWLLKNSGIQIDGSPLWVSPRVYLDVSGPGSITLGDGCVISHYVSILTHDFSMDRAVAQLRGPLPDNKEYYRSAPVTVGKNAFLGLHVIVLPGINIGDGAIVGAGAVVTRDIPDNGIVAGNPAKLLGFTSDNLDERIKKFKLGDRRR